MMRALLSCFLISISFACGAARAGTFEVPDELAKRGIPREIDFTQEMRFEDWQRYLIEIEQRGAGKAVDEADLSLFSQILSLESAVHPSYRDEFAAVAYVFAGTKHQEEVGKLCRELLLSKDSTDWNKVFAAEALSFFGDRNAVEPLLGLYMNEDDSISKIAGRSLKRLGYSLPERSSKEGK